jgi:uncharacterized repeat protein (TIGR03803 family)
MPIANRQTRFVERVRQNVGSWTSPGEWLFLPKTFLSNRLRVAVLGTLWLAITPALHAQTYTDLHEFDCTVEGCDPFYPEIMAQGRDGNLYGTLGDGGTATMGTVFKMTPSGTMTTLYNFSGADAQRRRVENDGARIWREERAICVRRIDEKKKAERIALQHVNAAIVLGNARLAAPAFE